MTDLEALMQYLRQSATDYAYMLTGPWGSGKSHFWNKTAIPAIARASGFKTNPKLAYVSLYGLKDLDQIHRSILLQTHPTLAKAGNVVSVLGRAAMEIAGVGSVTEKVDIGEWLTGLAKQKDLVICFDDLERCPLPVSDVLGRINQYVEHLGAKVVVLCNEEEIKKQDAAAYRTTKEKVVRVTRDYIGDPEAALDSIIEEFAGNENFHTFLKEQRTRIVGIFNKNQSRNLRILKYGLFVLEVAYNALDDMGAEGRGLVAKLPLTLLPATFEYQRGSFTAADVTAVLTDRTSLLAGVIGKERADEPSNLKQFITRYSVSMLLGETLVSFALAELIISGHLDQEKLKAEIIAQSAVRTEAAAAALKFSAEWYIMEDEEFSRGVSVTLKAIEEGEISDWEELIRIVRAFGECQEAGILPEEISRVKKAFTDGIQRLKQAGTFVRLAHHAALNVGPPRNDSSGLIQWAREQLIAVNEELAAQQQRQSVRDAFAAIEADPDTFADLMAESRGNGFGYAPMVKFVSPEEFLSMIQTATSKVRQRLSSAIRQRYTDNHNVKALAADIGWLKKVAAGIKKELTSSKKKITPSFLWLNKLLESIGDATEALKAEAGAATSSRT